jgi:hypothetical protein
MLPLLSVPRLACALQWQFTGLDETRAKVLYGPLTSGCHLRLGLSLDRGEANLELVVLRAMVLERVAIILAGAVTRLVRAHRTSQTFSNHRCSMLVQSAPSLCKKMPLRFWNVLKMFLT